MLASWAGADKPGASLNGGVLKGLVLMRISGAAATQPSPPLRTLAHRYIAHESAHFWLGQLVDYDKVADNWIVEGGADLLAIRALGATEPGYDTRAALQKSLTDCIAASTRGGLASATQRQDFQVKYDCGAILSLVAEKAAGGDFPAFVRRLLAANAADRAVSTEEWLALLESYPAGRNLTAHYPAAAQRRAADPARLDRFADRRLHPLPAAARPDAGAPVTNPSFTLTLTAEPAHIDELGHVNNAVWVQWIQTVATSHWYATAPEEYRDAFVWVVIRHEIDYLRPALVGDVVTGRTWVDEAPRGARFDRFMEFTNDDGEGAGQGAHHLGDAR